MSHKVTGKVKVANLDLVKALAESQGLAVKKGVQKFHSHQSEGLLVWLPGWKYPVCFTEAGEVNYDNYNERWGKQAQLDNFLQSYAQADIIQNASAMGFAVTSSVTANGDLILDLQKDTGHVTCFLDKEGKVSYEVNGIPGGNCLEYASFLASAVQGQMEYTEEFGIEPRQTILNQEIDGGLS